MCDNNNNNNNNNINSNNNKLEIIQENISHPGFGLNDPLIQITPQMQHNINAVDAYNLGDGRPGSTLPSNFPEISPQVLPWNFPHLFSPAHFPTREPDPFLIPPPPGLFRPPGVQFGYEPGPSDHLRLISESLGQVMHPIGSAPFGLQAELQKMTAQEIMDAKALAASKSHSEAERRRRERINNHLAKLRSLLPNTTKTDKASLLAEVIQHVKELKRQTSAIAETSPVPTETDELTVDSASPEEGKPVIKASICCEDRPDLLPELIGTLKALRLKTLRAEITTLGGRVKNVLFVTGDDESNGSDDMGDDEDHDDGGDEQQQQNKRLCISSIQEALKSVMEKTGNGEEPGSGSVKRQRTNINIVDHRSL